MSRLRASIMSAAAVVIAISGLVGLSALDRADTPAVSAAAIGGNFQAGYIISDSTFYNPGTMSAPQIQSFLQTQVPTCASGGVCLFGYIQQTAALPAVAGRCAAYPGGGVQSAAQIIWQVAQSCNVNPQVLIVLLQKEQGLITSTNPSASAYRSATGFGCPDTAACNTSYYGFFNQVYNAALQFQRYRNSPNSFNFRAGQNNTIQYSPNPACGSSTVYIQNQATAGLYDYTPYQPDAAALANVYGVGDGCSSYGNRNFWRYFTDWFGSPTGGSTSSLVRSTSGPQVYLLSGTTRYEVGNVQMLNALAPLGPVITVNDQYIASFSDGGEFSPVVGDPNGNIYFIDNGGKWHFDSCARVVNWGASSCADYTQLSVAQLASFTNLGILTNTVQEANGALYEMADGQLEQAVNLAALRASGDTDPLTQMATGALVTYPYGTPILADNIFIQDADDSTTSGLYYGGALHPIPGPMSGTTSLPTISSGVLDQTPYVALTRSSVLSAFVSGGSGTYVLTPTGRRAVTSTWGAPVTQLPATIWNQIPADSGAALASTAIIHPQQGDSIFLLSGSTYRGILSIADLLAAQRQFAEPTAITVAGGALRAITAGPPYIAPGSIVVDQASGNAYLVDGDGTRFAIPSFAITNALGFTAPGRVLPSAVVNSFPASSQSLSVYVTCGTTNYLADAGTLRPVPASVASAAGFGTPVALSASLCSQLTLSASAVTQFLSSPTGDLYYLSNGQKHWVSSSASWQSLGATSANTTSVSEALIQGLTTGIPILQASNRAYVPGFVTARGASSIYLVQNSTLRPVQNLTALADARAGAADPTVYSLPPDALDFYPIGAMYLMSGGLAHEVSSQSIYLVNGTASRVPVTSISQLVELGSLARSIPDGGFAGYPAATTSLSPLFQCASSTYLLVDGELWPLTADGVTRFALPTTSVLDPTVCADMPQSSVPLASFLRASNGTIYQVVAGVKHPIASLGVLSRLGGGGVPIPTSTGWTIGQYPTGSLIS